MPTIRILVVDDSAVIRRVLCDALTSDPAIEVAATAANGHIALSKIPQVNPDLITLDIEMPVMNGLEALAEIRKLYPKLPVIMFSTLTERGAASTLEALSLGASDYASAQVDKRKAGRLAYAIQVAFQELGVFETSNTKVPLQDDDAMPFEKVQIVENTQKDTDLSKIVNPMKGILTSSAESQSLQDAKVAIQKALNPEIQRREVTMSMRPDGLVISLKEMGFFDSGTATIRPDSLDAVARLAAVLKQRPEDLRVEGHTDNIPIHNSKFASNWELSTARATELINLLITGYGLPPGRLSAAGYGEYHPVATNSTPAGRAQNRRLDVVILAPFQPANIDNGNFVPDAVPARGP